MTRPYISNDCLLPTDQLISRVKDSRSLRSLIFRLNSVAIAANSKSVVMGSSEMSVGGALPK